jgi:hypothetical protein
VTFSGTVADDKASSATASLALGAQQPAELVVRPSAEEFELGASVQANVLVLDESGLGVAEMNVTLSAPGFEIKSRRSGENGVYAFDGSVKNYPKGGNLSLTATLPRTNGAPIEGVATVRIKKPAGARTARFDTAPTFLWAGSPPVPIVATVLDAVGDPVPPEGATLVAVGAVMTHPRLEGSSLTATLTPPRYPHAVKLEVRSPEGRIIAERIIDVAGDSELVYLGARVGAPGSFSSVISPRFGVEAMVRPRVFEDQILIGMMVSATAGGVTDVRSSPTGPLSRESVVALSLRFALDDLRFGPFSFQPGVGIQGAWINPLNGNTGSPALASHLAAGANIFLTASGRIGPGRAFLEVGNGVMPVSKPDLVMNASGFYVDAGYRVALF